MKKLVLSGLLASTLITSTYAWDFCSTESQIGVAGTSMGVGVLIADATLGGVPGLIVGVVLNQVLCTPTVEEKADEPKTLVDNALKTSSINDAKTVYFDFDKYTINAQGKDAVNATVNVLKTMPGVPVRIEGNADSRGSDEYNYALGLKRATEVKNALINTGVTNTLQTVSYGESKPACTETNEDCFSKNRRVEFKTVD